MIIKETKIKWGKHFFLKIIKKEKSMKFSKNIRKNIYEDYKFWIKRNKKTNKFN